MGQNKYWPIIRNVVEMIKITEQNLEINSKGICILAGQNDHLLLHKKILSSTFLPVNFQNGLKGMSALIAT